jgi:hypothetical protein
MDMNFSEDPLGRNFSPRLARDACKCPDVPSRRLGRGKSKAPIRRRLSLVFIFEAGYEDGWSSHSDP